MENARDKRESQKGMGRRERERLIFHIDVNSAFLSWECVYRLSQAPEAIRSIFSSGITTGGLTAIIANIVIRVKEENEE